MNVTAKKLIVALFALATAFVAAAGAEVGDKIPIGVLPFDNKAKGVTIDQADIITDVFTRELVQSKTLAVIERTQLQKIGEEQRFEQSALVEQSTAVEIGKIAGVRYVLLGAVTQLAKIASGTALYGLVLAKDEAVVTIDARIIDVATAEVVMALSAEGTSTNDTVGFVSGNVGFIDGKFSGNETAAIADAVAALAHEVRSALGGESSHVIAVESDEIVVGVTAPREGALYLVYTDGKRLTDMSGRLVGANKIPIAIVKVRDVNYGHSTAVIVPNGGNKNMIRRGDKVEPISPKKAKQFADGKKFVKSRPKEQNNIYDAVFGDDSAPSTPTPAEVSAPGDFKWSDVEGVDRNNDTGFELISAYPLDDAEKNTLSIAHRGAYNLYNQGKYKEALEAFAKLAEDYKCDYLSAYWAGMSAMKIGDNGKDTKSASYRKALDWFSKALDVNPDYKPASDARMKVE
jgi:curli biogenesis system outer membrane secretion channel CsgG/TolA-binding protein